MNQNYPLTMIEHLQKVMEFRNSVNAFKNEQMIALSWKWSDKKRFKSHLSILSLGFFSLIIGLSDAYAQCNPVISIAGNRTTYCVTENVDFALSVAVTPAQDTFFGNGVTDVDNTDHAGLFNPASAGAGTFDINYLVQVGGGGCNATEVATLSITVSSIPNAGIDGEAFICQETGATVDLFTGLSGTPMTTGTWAAASGVTPTGYLGTLDDTQIAALPTGTTDFFYTVAGVGTCTDSTSKVTLTVTALPTITGVDNIPTACSGNSAMVTVNGLVDKNYLVSYRINNILETDVPITSSGGVGVFATRALTAADNGMTLTVVAISDTTVTPNCTNNAISENKVLTVTDNPEIQGRDTTICGQTSFDLSLLVNTIIAGDNREYGDAFGNYNRGTNAIVTPLTVGATTYYVRDSNNVTQCIDTARIIVTVLASPNAGTIVGDNEICEGEMDTLVIAPSGGTGSYTDTTWLTGDASIATIANGIVTGVAGGIVNISYVIEDANGCTDTSANHPLIVYPLPVAGDITGDTALCLGTTTTLTANPSSGTGAYTITWFSTFDTVATVNASGVITPVSPGLTDIYYMVSDSKSCEAVSNVFDVRVDTLPTIVFNVSDADSTICLGDAVTFTATGGVMYEFLLNTVSIGAASAINTYVTDTLNDQDIIRVVATNMSGCVDTSAMIIMNVNALPVATIVSDDADNTVGIGQDVVFTATGGTNYEFFVNNSSVQGPLSFDTFAINTLGHLDTILVEVTDGNGCIDTASIVMMVNFPPTAVNDTVEIAEDTPEILIGVQNNDTDPEGDGLTTTIITDSSNGLDNTLNDSIRYIPNLNFNGNDSIIYNVCDAFSNCDTATVYITVTPVNDAPLAADDTLFILEDGPISFVDVQANDMDPDGDSLVTSISTSLGLGTAVVLMSDSISYTPNPNFNGTDIVVYQVCDTGSLCDVGLLRVFITPVNDAPVAAKDSVVINEDSLNIQVAILANDIDVDGDAINIDSVYAPTSGGTVTVSNDTVLYNPPANFTGLDSIQYAICDTALCDTNYLIINVLPVPEPPVAVKDSVTIPEDTAHVKIALLANDFDYDGDVIMIDSLFEGTLGPIGILSNDTLCYTPPANFNGIDSIKYIITDGIFKDSTYIIINVLPISDPPIAVNDTITVLEDVNPAIIAVQANDSDPDGDLFATSIVSGPSNGTAVEAGGNVDYIPTTSFNGMDTITYRICDAGVPSQCDTATIFITVTGVNDAPVAMNDTICITEDTSAILIAVKMNDVDIDGDALTASIMTGATQSMVDSIRNDTIVYQPVLNFNGTDSILYQISDGTLNDQAWVYIKIDPKNDAPVAMQDSMIIPEDTSNVIIAVTINDTDVDAGDSLVATIVTGPTSSGTATILNDTSIVYNPPANFNGIDTIVYQVCDTSAACDMTTVIMTVLSAPDRPIAVDDAYSVPEDTTNVVIDVQLNDSDGDGDILTTRIVSTFMTADTLNGDSIIFSPPADSANVQLIAYEICDTTGLCDTAVVTITITPVNDAPIAVDDIVVINQDTSNVGIAAAANDTDIDDTVLTVSSVTTPTAANGVASVLGIDSILYTPLAGFSGLDTIHYTVCDSSNACDNGLVLISVGFINTPPIAVNDTLMGIVEDAASGTINVLLNDSDVNGSGDSLKITAVTTPTNGGTATISGDSMIVYSPPAEFNGLDSVQYIVCDTSFGCANAWVFFTINSINDKPVAIRDTVFLNKDTTNAQFVVKANDIDVDGDMLTVTVIGNSTQGVTPTVVNDSILYSAPAGYVGMDEITYKVSDPDGLMDTTTVTVMIIDPNNIPPVANTDFGTASSGIAIIIDVQSNDMEPNGDSLITTIVSVANANNTAVVLNQDSIQYTPATNFAGPDTIIYQICDPSLTCDTDTVFVLVENTLAVSARVILEGPYDETTTLMHDSLRVLGFIPMTEPYSTLPYLPNAYQFQHKGAGGNETITDVAVLNVTGGNAIVDWVYLELLGKSDTIPVASRAALLQRDGDIVDVDGVSPVSFELLPNGEYFLSIRHRNHLGVMTDTATTFSMGAFTTIDFTEQQSTGGAAIYGEHPVDTIGAKLVLWAGDGNGDREISFAGIDNDRIPVFFEVIGETSNTGSNYNHVSYGYHMGDLDMRGSTIYSGNKNDPDVIFFNIFVHPKNNLLGNTPTVNHIIREQIHK